MAELTADNIKIKKHLGQYFSGEKIATLLAELSQFERASSIIDPMCGVGDMLKACYSPKSRSASFTGVEIDKDVSEVAHNNLSDIENITVQNGNAFNSEVLKYLSKKQYDLVITNPPYVRYQTISNSNQEEPNHLNATQIRKNLLNSIPNFSNISQQDKSLIKTLIKGYSGLSDLAVPSWLLCAMLTKVNGRIAMVVPQTWLNREYANIIQYLLLKWFKVEYIIEDGNSSWFPLAQVKTTLLVAKRIETKKSILSWTNENFIYCTVYSNASSKSSIVGNAVNSSNYPEKEFIELINKKNESSDLFKSMRVSLNDFAHELFPKISKAKWYKSIEGKNDSNDSIKLNSNRIKVPSELSTWLGNNDNRFITLDDIGVSVSQGLRTGANKFFYLDIISKTETGVIARPHKSHSQTKINISDQCYKEVLRKQSELTDEFSLTDFSAKGIVLYLSKHVLQSDITDKGYPHNWYEPVSLDLEKYIITSSTINIGTETETKHFPSLSAVKPNVRNWNSSKPTIAPRFWYQLPTFTKRHFPDFFVPRVNGHMPRVRLNPSPSIIIDANFSSLWISDNKSNYDKYSLLSLLNSSWCVVAMEEYGTVMGGGALKLEATHIKKIPIPNLDKASIERLSEIGKGLVAYSSDSETLLYEVDMIISSQLFLNGELASKVDDLIKIKYNLWSLRNNK